MGVAVQNEVAPFYIRTTMYITHQLVCDACRA